MSLTARPLLPVTGRSVELELTPDPPFRLEEGKEYTIRCTPPVSYTHLTLPTKA